MQRISTKTEVELKTRNYEFIYNISKRSKRNTTFCDASWLSLDKLSKIINERSEANKTLFRIFCFQGVVVPSFSGVFTVVGGVTPALVPEPQISQLPDLIVLIVHTSGITHFYSSGTTKNIGKFYHIKTRYNFVTFSPS